VIFGYGLWMTPARASDGRLLAMGAYFAFGWFLVTTRAHENHSFMALPLLAMAVPRARFLGVAFGIISLTLFLNMTLHDFGTRNFWVDAFGIETWLDLQLANAAINVALFAAWSAWLLRGLPSPALPKRPGLREQTGLSRKL